jgi:hypothetical protein
VEQQQVVPMIHIPDLDVSRTIDWYVSVGFKILNTVEDEGGMNWALLANGNSQIMVTGGGRSTTDDRRDVDLYIHTHDVEGLFRQLKDRVEIRLGLRDTLLQCPRVHSERPKPLLGDVRPER